MSYQLKMYPYSGSSCVLMEGSKEECRARAARKIRYHRNRMEYPVLIMERGEKWELESDPDGCCMISDNEGILALEDIIEDDFENDFEDVFNYCSECGNSIEFDTALCEECERMSEEEDDCIVIDELEEMEDEDDE